MHTRMSYVRNTNVLRTEVETPDATYEVFDFAPRAPAVACTSKRRSSCIGWYARCEGRRACASGSIRGPTTARAPVDLVPTGAGLEIRGGPHELFLRTNIPMHVRRERVSVPHRSAALLRPELGPAERRRYHGVGRARARAHHGRLARLGQVVRAADVRAGGGAALGAVPEAPRRSRDTGAIIAAATTSIPEALGSVRTWDYRFCWLRDAAFVVEALRRLSHLAEGEAFVRFLRDVADRGPLQPVYGIGGERDLVEETLEHFAGFEGVGPVRIGNAAYTQNQHDLMGELILCLETMLTDPRVVYDDPHGDEPGRSPGRRGDCAVGQEDTGLWEYRTMPRHYTFSKVMCWVAAERGAGLARAVRTARQSQAVARVGRS